MTDATNALERVLKEITTLGNVSLGVVAERVGANFEGELTDSGGLAERYASLSKRDWERAEFSEELRYENQAKVLVATPDSQFPHLAHMILV